MRLGSATARPAMAAMPETTGSPPANPAMAVATPRVRRYGECSKPVASTTATPTATSSSRAALTRHNPCSCPMGLTVRHSA